MFRYCSPEKSIEFRPYAWTFLDRCVLYKLQTTWACSQLWIPDKSGTLSRTQQGLRIAGETLRPLFSGLPAESAGLPWQRAG